jgi:hypothetical protein
MAVSVSSASAMKSSSITRLLAVCDTSKINYGYTCTVNEIEAILRPLQQKYENVIENYNSLVRSNVELLCGPSLGYWDQWVGSSELERLINRDRMFGPCLFSYSEDFQSKLHNLFFPCSNPNTRFEQFFPTPYWAGYYDSVNRSQEYGGCSDHYFASAIGLSNKFLDVWKYRWSLIFEDYKSLIVEYTQIMEEAEPMIREYERAKSIPARKPGACQWNKNDPTEGFIAKGKTVVDRYGYKFTCRNSKILRTGRVPLKAIGLWCPEYDSPTGNNCSVRTSWGTSSQLNQLPRYKPAGRVIDTGWYISISGYKCTIKLYANSAFKDSCK